MVSTVVCVIQYASRSLPIILGQAVLMGDWRLVVYGALLWLFFHVFVVAYEEPMLEQTFGGEYQAFCAAVPRWMPRMSPSRSN